MYEENKRFNWAGLFIKIIIVVIFILFTVWLLSLSNKGLSTSLGVLTDNIFSENMEKMKEVGKSYFTTERLPEKVGEVNILTLDRMYDKKLLLTLKDKDGNTCSATNSYVSIEKMENEYQMKVYLECGDKSDYIIAIMGCYSYCDSDICEKQELQGIEYEYKKTLGGSWTSWGNWSDWSKTSISKTNYRDVETKVVREDYTYEKDVTETKFVGNATCEYVAGYTLVSNKNGVCTYNANLDTRGVECPYVSGYTMTGKNGFTCNYKKSTADYKDPTCPTVTGYKNTGRNGFSCEYTMEFTLTKDPTCPTVSGYTNTGRTGFTCNYTRVNNTVDPTCPEVSGYTNTGRNGFTCNYSKTNSSSVDPTCPEVSGYTFVVRSGFTCNYTRSVRSSNYTLEYYSTGSGTYVPADTDTYHYEQTSADYQYKCDSTCGFQWYYTYKIYKKVYTTTTENLVRTATCTSGVASGNTCVIAATETTTRGAICPNGYNQSGNTCVAQNSTTTRTAICGDGYNRNGNKCEYHYSDTINNTAQCPTEYSRSGNTCIGYPTTTRTGKCPIGYKQLGNICVSSTTGSITKNAICPSKQTMQNGKCYETVTNKEKVTEKRDVTYYRYRLRDLVGGTTDYKWSISNNDKSLLNDGYTLTGKTREVTLKGEGK